MQESQSPVRLQVVEIFGSIQGEGIYVGTPSTFIRLAGCNQQCCWCDTPYAQDSNSGTEMTIEEIVNHVPLVREHVVITGGEPLLQPIEALIFRMSPDHILTVETNGTIYPDSMTARKFVDLWSVSPKLASSGYLPALEVLRQFVYDKLIRRLQFKFVVDTIGELNAAMYLFDKMESPRQVDVVIQPVCNMPPNGAFLHNLTTYIERTQTLANTIVDRQLNVRIIPQLQKIIWGNVRGR